MIVTDLGAGGEHFKTGTTGPIDGVMHLVVDVPFVGSAWLFFAMVALYAGTSSDLGILAVTCASNSGQVGLIVLLVMPIIMPSGTWNLRESMPVWLQRLVDLSPLRYFVDIAYCCSRAAARRSCRHWRSAWPRSDWPSAGRGAVSGAVSLKTRITRACPPWLFFLTFEFTGLRGFSHGSCGMIGYRLIQA